MTTEATMAATAADPLKRLSGEGVATFEAAWRDLLDVVPKFLNSKGVDGR